MKSRYYRARGGRVDAHEAREMQMMREMMQMHPGMAEGGYIVGERGPEMFMPDQPGTVIPHHELIRLARKYGGHVSNKRRR